MNADPLLIAVLMTPALYGICSCTFLFVYGNYKYQLTVSVSQFNPLAKVVCLLPKKKRSARAFCGLIFSSQF